MGEVTLKVPSEQVETLRRGALAELADMAAVVREDAERIVPVPGKGDPERWPETPQCFREDSATHRRQLAEATALLDQIPEHDPVEGEAVEVRGSLDHLWSVTEEAARALIADLAEARDTAPLVDQTDECYLISTAEDVAWWVAEHNKMEALRLARLKSREGVAA